MSGYIPLGLGSSGHNAYRLLFWKFSLGDTTIPWTVVLMTKHPVPVQLNEADQNRSWPWSAMQELQASCRNGGRHGQMAQRRWQGTYFCQGVTLLIISNIVRSQSM